MDANLNNPAAALIAASQSSSGTTPGAAPGLPGGRNETAIGSQSAPAGESDFSSKIRSLQQDSVKEARASEAAGSGTEAPGNEPSAASDRPAASTESTASTVGDEQASSDQAGLAPADGDGKLLPATGKELPVIELMAEVASDTASEETASAAVDEASVQADVEPATPDLDLAPSVPDDSARTPPAAEAPIDSDPAMPPGAQARTAEAAELTQTRPEQAFAGNASAAQTSNPTNSERGAATPTSAPASPATAISSVAAAPGARSDGASMNFDGGTNSQAGLPGNGETQASNSGNAQRVAFSAEPPALATAAGAGPASTASATATLAELDTLAGTRPLQPQAGQEQFARGLGERMLLMADGGLQSARIKLSPENLGPLDIRIQVQDDATQVWFNASQSQTREILEQAMPRLRELLADQGMRLTDANVTGGENGGSDEAGDEAQAPERDWRQPPPPTLDEQIAGRSLHQLIEARRLLDVYA